MNARRARVLVVVLALAGCVSGSASLDPEARWQRAEKRHGVVTQALEEARLLRSDYDAVIRLDRSGSLRGRAYLGLAELDLARQEYEAAAWNLEQALRASLAPPQRVEALLLLGDVLERRLDRAGEARTVYHQILHEHPGGSGAELARARLGRLSP